jgi:hypothetical protein
MVILYKKIKIRDVVNDKCKSKGKMKTIFYFRYVMFIVMENIHIAAASVRQFEGFNKQHKSNTVNLIKSLQFLNYTTHQNALFCMPFETPVSIYHYDVQIQAFYNKA